MFIFRMRISIISVMVFLFACNCTWGEDSKPLSPREQKKQLIKRLQAEAIDAHKKITDAYLSSDFDRLDELFKECNKYRMYYQGNNRREVRYVKSGIKKHRPKWWKKCDNTKPVSFKAEIWKKKFTANYMPSSELGYQAAALYKGKLVFYVTWQPHMLESDTPFKNAFAKKYGFKKGDLAEAIVWHELGHNYVNICLPQKHVIKLYIEHRELFSHLQEFYADMTSIYHSSPQAQRLTMVMRLPSLFNYKNGESHTRAAHAIASILITQFLESPEKWPAVNFPTEIPKSEIELNTIRYIYKNFSTDWSIKEDAQLRNFIKTYLKKNGEKALRKKGELKLPNKLEFELIAFKDGKNQKNRDKWVAKKLKTIIESGRAKKLEDKIPNKDINIFKEILSRR